MDLGPETMQKLADLLRPPEPDVLQGENLKSTGCEITSTRDKNVKNISEGMRIPKTIEEFEEQEARECEEMGRVGAGLKDRPTPPYSMTYQQAVTAEDVFLQIGPKTPSTTSCENLIVKIKLKGDKRENVDLSVTTTSVTVSSSHYYLELTLPHSIEPDDSKAIWDTAEETLILTLKLDREFDFINF
ncbi:Protein PIH1D3 [Eumeta japonica]|uniref:Protein PIH1D3 n=1 Tax=Eumeta variegata TaxID=151549 RepID=A0A4C1WDG1_EUMVA|nr:Protein PIH1D3 [Eumeta japonica]